MLGSWFGNREHAPTNIASLSLLLLFGFLAILVFADLPDGLDRATLVSTTISTITLVLGFLFGRNVT